MADVAEEIVDAVEEEVEEIEEEEEEFAPADATEVKLFGKWSFDDIEIRDISLEVRRKCKQTETALWTNAMRYSRLGLCCAVFFCLDIHFSHENFLSSCLRITLHARETMPFTFHTQLDDTNKRDSARLLALSWNVWCAA